MPRGSPRLRAKDGRYNIVGERVRLRREQENMTQDALCARIANVTSGAWNPDRRDVYRIEDGRRSVYDVELIALAEALGCEFGWLVQGTNR